MKRVVADLHVHTCLSPCSELEMTPLAVVAEAAKKGIDMIAVTDHNSARNAEAALKAGLRMGVAVLPAMEITSREEAHVLALFPSLAAAASAQEQIYAGLPEYPAEGRRWQVVVNEEDEVLDFESRALLSATSFSLNDLVGLIHKYDGLAIAAHVDREAFSIGSQLGFAPPEAAFDAFEVLNHAAADAVLPFHKSAPRLMSSDAHHPGGLGRRCTALMLEGASFQELSMALKGLEGRHIIETLPTGTGGRA